ncbi:MAG: hypothetical protein CVU36_10595 [Betaproteobacteria bacterium HGW-Betaproteobacteria-9]|jgi:hypothetical protein|nr:MAG: hypothetical protein CVU36_10595 [Betaproteobacteria bacterium HGW-Betaproteobacteria-9]
MTRSGTIIYECLYAKDQALSDSHLAPLPITNDHPEWRELQAFLEIYRRGDWRQHDFTGMFSPKFALKTHIGVDRFLGFVADNADADVCLINPFPQIGYWSYNVWMQGEHAHPGLGAAAQALLDAVGIPWQLREVPRHGPGLLAYGNFWVARPAFWQAYVGEVLQPIADFLLREPSHQAVLGILSSTRHTDAAPFLPFMIERLFSTYLSLNSQWRVAAYPQQNDVQRYCQNDFERLLQQQLCDEVDAADARQCFPLPLIAHMNKQCALFQQHFFDYYRHHLHPHSGKTVNR